MKHAAISTNPYELDPQDIEASAELLLTVAGVVRRWVSHGVYNSHVADDALTALRAGLEVAYAFDNIDAPGVKTYCSTLLYLLEQSAAFFEHGGNNERAAWVWACYRNVQHHLVKLRRDHTCKLRIKP